MMCAFLGTFRLLWIVMMLFIASYGCARTSDGTSAGGEKAEGAVTDKKAGHDDGGLGPAARGPDGGAVGGSDGQSSTPRFFRTALDLRNNRYLAHLYRDGLVIPLNDPGVEKYVPTHTKPGLASHIVESKRSLRVVGRHGVLALPLSSDSCADGCWLYLALEQRIRKQYLGIFLNKHVVPTQAVAVGPSVIRARIPPGVVVDGENRLRFYFARKGVEGGKKVSADLFWLAISRTQDTGLTQAFPNTRIARGKRRGLNFQDYHSWVWNLAVPPAAQLELAWSEGDKCPVSVVVEGVSREKVVVPVSHRGDLVARFDLSAFVSEAGGVVRLKIERKRPAILYDARLVVEHHAGRVLGKDFPQKVVLWVTAGLSPEVAGESDGDRQAWASFDSLKSRGVFFPNVVAQSPSPTRSLTGILAGTPPQIIRSLLSEKNMSAYKKSFLPWILRKENWATAFFSGEAKFQKADLQRVFHEIHDFQPVVEEQQGKSPLSTFEAWLEENKKGAFFAVVAPWSRRAYFRYREGYTDAKIVKEYRGELPTTVGGLTFSRIRTEKRKLRMRDRDFMRALAEGEAAFQDKLLGELLSKLQELQIDEDTLLVVVGAGGVELFEHGGVGFGHSLHREATSVPMIFVHPKTLPGGVVVHTGAELIDLAPTVLAALGLNPPERMMGGNLIQLVRNAFLSPPRPGFTRKNAFEQAISLGNYRLLRILGQDDRVYDLSVDPGEHRPLMDQMSPAVRALKDAMSFYRKYATRWRKARHGLPSNQSETFAEDSRAWWGRQ